MNKFALCALIASTFVIASPVQAKERVSCKSFKTQKEAQAWYDKRKASGKKGWKALDRNNDGSACDALPGGKAKKSSTTKTKSKASSKTNLKSKSKTKANTKTTSNKSTTSNNKPKVAKTSKTKVNKTSKPKVNKTSKITSKTKTNTKQKSKSNK